MYMVQIEESKIDKLTDYTGKAMRYMMKAMDCISEMSGHHIDERRGGTHGDYPINMRHGRYPMEMEDHGYDHEEERMMDERRRYPYRRMPY